MMVGCLASGWFGFGTSGSGWKVQGVVSCQPRWLVNLGFGLG